MTPPPPDQVPAHGAWEELAVGHALDALEPADEAAFAGHLPSCESCRRLVTDMREIGASLAFAADPIDLPPSLWHGIAAALESSDRPPLPPSAQENPARDHTTRPAANPTPARRATDRAPTPRAPERPGTSPRGGAGRRPAWLRSTALALVAALVGIVGLGGVVLVGRFLQVRGEKAAAQRQLSAVLTCAGRTDCAVVQLKPEGDSRASAVALVEKDSVQLVVHDLPATDRDSSYVLWAEKAGVGLKGVARFTVSNRGRHIISPDLESPVDVGSGLTMAVSREPGRAIPAEPSVPPTLQGKSA